MVVTQVLCNMCGRPLYTEVADGAEVTHWNHGTKLEQLPHLCKSCALKTDNAVDKRKEYMT